MFVVIDGCLNFLLASEF